VPAGRRQRLEYSQINIFDGTRVGSTVKSDQARKLRRSQLTIRDKVEGERTIPLTPYVENLLTALPRRNQWVFSSPASKIGHITEPNAVHSTACTVAGLEGLRRSFKSLTEWLDMPAGAVAQNMGQKPSATAEKHYTVRPLELLASHHNKIEVWVLEQAGIAFDPATAGAGSLRVVA
jgi:hypothetical protein